MEPIHTHNTIPTILGKVDKNMTSNFISRNTNPRILHSFPTRRSSDLRERPAALGQLGSPAQRAPLAGADEDRKSTRLNSSHVAISYAVFCLKKKIIVSS